MYELAWDDDTGGDGYGGEGEDRCDFPSGAASEPATELGHSAGTNPILLQLGSETSSQISCNGFGTDTPTHLTSSWDSAVDIQSMMTGSFSTTPRSSSPAEPPKISTLISYLISRCLPPRTVYPIPPGPA